MGLVAYNRLASAFGLVSGTFKWQLSGEIEFSYAFHALPTAMFGAGSNWRSTQMGPDLALLVLVSVFAALTCYDIVTTWRIERKAAILDPSHTGDSRGTKRWKSFSNRVSPSHAIPPPGPVAEGIEREEDGRRAATVSPAHKKKHASKLHFQSRTTFFWVVYEITQLGLMAGSIATWIIYSSSLYHNNEAYRTRFAIYDADASAPCRFLLPFRETPTNSTSLAPGVVGRWEIPGSSTGLTDMAGMLNHSSYLSSLLMMYQMLNGIIIVMFFL